ncbi:PRKR-interacting protein 1 [Trichoplax sp. H2]|uniref:PRKR-interacting protein 1 homolog n=1 Tax=Trichoplax adhaerens TaxID=10228 RepID=B3S6H8_TRIAD|nr:hypothetical protein TRIADDRAFT_59810 [Trichoplax adhaerens]EDV21623.1 hypothetical protein TRIADDRAFT_59810 [Trichoplax adhaerens]RDD47503.1 PRKR-interacting protein 1 [Trichoplax sp. H2]|eukprot:XP_002115771.1 hypothetical protein TRIADDRAFT_59810 [Trichoplax adhaerens]
MATKQDEKASNKPDKTVIVPKNCAQVQKIHLDRLMKNVDRPIHIPKVNQEKASPLPPEFVREIMGSSAGAGSGEFHVYRGSRRREYNRLRLIEEQAKKDESNQELQRKIESDRKETEERTAKKRNKRLRKKQKQLEHKKRNTGAATMKEDMKSNDRDEDNSDSVETQQVEENSFIIGGR